MDRIDQELQREMTEYIDRVRTKRLSGIRPPPAPAQQETKPEETPADEVEALRAMFSE